MKRTWKPIGSLLLALCMVITMLPVTAFADDPPEGSGTGTDITAEITAFADLDAEVSEQTVKAGTTEDELDLPDELTVTVTTVATSPADESGDETATDSDAREPETQETEIETTVAVDRWTAYPDYSPDYDPEGENTYIFTPTLDLLSGITAAEGVSAPAITVTVESAAPTARGAIQLMASSGSVKITDGQSVSEIKSAIESALNNVDSGGTVTVTGYKSGAATESLAFAIPAGKKVVWKVNYQAGGMMTDPLLDLTGSGSFEVAEEALISASNSDIVAINAVACDVIVSGGWIISRGDKAIIGKNVTISGGKVQAGDEYDPEAGSMTAVTGENVTISGGTVLAHPDSYAVEATGNITITGGSVRGELNKTPTNGTANVYPVTLSGLPDQASIITMSAPSNYNVNDVDADSSGKLYFCLPVGETAISLKEYYGTVYIGNVTVTAEGPNAAVLRPDNPVAEDFASLKMALEDTTATTDSKPILVTKDIPVTGQITVGANHYLKFENNKTITVQSGGSLIIPAGRELQLPNQGTLKIESNVGVIISGTLSLMNNTLSVENSAGNGVTIESTGELDCLNAKINVANTGGVGISSEGDIHIGSNGKLTVENQGGSTGSTGISGSVTMDGASSQLLVQNTGNGSTGISGAVTIKNGSAEIKNGKSETGGQNVGISSSSLIIESSQVSVKSAGTGDNIVGIMMKPDSVTNTGSMKLSVGSNLTVDTPHMGIASDASAGITWDLGNSVLNLTQGRLNCTGTVLTGAADGKIILAEGGIVAGMSGKLKDQDNTLSATGNVIVGAEESEPSANGLSAGTYTWDGPVFSKAGGAVGYDYTIDLASIADSPDPVTNGYSKTGDTITLNQANKTYRIYGTTTQYNLVADAVGTKVTLDNVNIDIRKDPPPSDPFSLKSVLEVKKDTTLILKGSSTFHGDLYNMISGIDYSPSLTVQGNGSLNVEEAFTYFKELNLNLSGGSLEAGSLSAKTIAIKNGDIQTGGIYADTLLDIRGGTTVVTAAADRRQTAPVNSSSAKISGGSFRLDYEPYSGQDQALFGSGEHPVNSAGAPVYLIRIVNLPSAAPAVVQASGYGAQGIKTDAEGSLYLWLPADTASIRVEAGEEAYNLTPTIAADDSANTVPVKVITYDAASDTDLKTRLERKSPATINVTADIILSKEITLGADHILNIPSDKKLTFTGETPAGSIRIDSRRTLTIQGGGAMESTRTVNYALTGDGVLKLDGVKLSLKNQTMGGMSVKTVNIGNGAEILIAGASSVLVIPTGGVFNINSGGTVTADGYSSAAIENSGMLNINSGGTLTLKAGTYPPALTNEAGGALICAGGTVAVDENVGVRLKKDSKVKGFAGKLSDRGYTLNTDDEITIAAADQEPVANQLAEALYSADSDGVLTYKKITITKQPENAAVTESAISDSDKLSVECSTPGVAYQWWRVNGDGSATGLPGATGSALSIPKNLKEGIYYYYCLLSLKGSDNVQSSTVTVTVQANPDPNPTPNYDVITRVSITGVTAPAADAIPTLSGIMLPGDAKYTILANNWYVLDDKGDMALLAENKPFELGKTYIFGAILAPKADEYFADANKMTLTVNSKKAELFDLGAAMEDYRMVIYSFGELKTDPGNDGHGGGSGGSSNSITPPTTPAPAPVQKAEPPVTNPNAPAKMADTAGHWGKEAIDYVLSRGLFAGTSETTFSPDSQMTRAMVWTVLARLDGQSTADGATWYALAQDWAKTNGISDGSMPQSSITREQLVLILYRYADSPAASHDLSGFADAGQISDWTADAMQWAVDNGLMVGADNRLNPAGNATRAEVSAILMRYIKLISN